MTVKGHQPVTGIEDLVRERAHEVFSHLASFSNQSREFEPETVRRIAIQLATELDHRRGMDDAADEGAKEMADACGKELMGEGSDQRQEVRFRKRNLLEASLSCLLRVKVDRIRLPDDVAEALDPLRANDDFLGNHSRDGLVDCLLQAIQLMIWVQGGSSFFMSRYHVRLVSYII